MKKIFILLLAVALIAGCKARKAENTGTDTDGARQEAVSGNFTISGAYALTGVVKKWADDFMKIHSDVKIEVLERGTGQGIVDLIDGKADLAMISRPLTDDEKEIGRASCRERV